MIIINIILVGALLYALNLIRKLKFELGLSQVNAERHYRSSFALETKLEETRRAASNMLEEIKEVKTKHAQEIKEARADAAKRSRAINFGHMAENMSPLLAGFPVAAEDVRFYGNPIDFIAFTDVHDKEKTSVKIIEVKTGRSQLTKEQSNIKNAIRDGRVEFMVVRVDEQGEVKTRSFTTDRANK